MSTKKEETSGAVYFEIQASMGTAKHPGGQQATEELLELCHVRKGAKVLEIGCGTGLTTRHIVKKYKIHVVGVDLSKDMIKRSKERAKKEHYENKTEFQIADAQKLPFEDNTFDIVFCESVIAFIPDRRKTIEEFKRVTKPGGYIGFNEVTWRKEPPQKLKDYFSRLMGDVEFLTEDEGKKLLQDVGFSKINIKIYKLKLLNEIIENLKRINLVEYFRAWYKLITGMITKPAYRKFAADSLNGVSSVFGIFKYWGYGYYIGKK